MFISNSKILPLFILFLAMPVSLHAEPVRSAHTEAELISEVNAVKAGTPFWVGLHLKMDPKWHTYWRNSGDSGLPTEIEWKLPAGFEAGPIQWPYPERFDLPPLSVYAYEGEVLLLTQIVPPQDLAAGQTISIEAKANWLACEVNCIPGKAHLTLQLPVQNAPVPEAARMEQFSGYRAKLPLPDAGGWEVSAIVDKDRILIRMKEPAWFTDELRGVQFFPYSNEWIDHAAPQDFRRLGENYELRVKRSTLSREIPERLAGVLVSETGWRGPGSERAVEIHVTPESGTVAAFQSSAESGGTPLALVLLFAFLGGMILNLMPCVFPVLSLKVLGFVEQAKGHRTGIWKHGASFTAGVLISFWVLAGLLLVLRSTGHAIGWGFQLQSPFFIVALSILFFLFALNLFGVFEVGAGLTRLGGTASGQRGLRGSFVSGVLATVVATPCTAPFMGSALGYALTQPFFVAMAVFTMLGLGMAFPYVLLSSFPALLNALPKPGIWMVYLKKAMGFILMATVVWLVWVLSLQAPSGAIVALAAGLFFISLGAWFYGLSQAAAKPSSAGILKLFAVLLFVSGTAWPMHALRTGEGLPAMKSISEPSGGGIDWQPYSPELLDTLLREGKPVFLDFTAAWCLTCHVNERVALNHAKVQERFRELGVVPVKADWTSRSEEVTAALARYGRSSIPLYVVYGKGPGAEPVILPEIITPRIVLNALEKIDTRRVNTG